MHQISSLMLLFQSSSVCMAQRDVDVGDADF
jgi:hypothetical protein